MLKLEKSINGTKAVLRAMSHQAINESANKTIDKAAPRSWIIQVGCIDTAQDFDKYIIFDSHQNGRLCPSCYW